MSLDINLRKEIKQMFDKNKYKVLLQRTSRKIRCKCYNEKYKEANSKCPICLGTGWLFKFEKHTTFKQDSTMSPESATLFTEIGELNHEYKIFYFEHDVHPQEKDYIWEVAWNHKHSKPTRLNKLYKIKGVSEQRGESGRIEFYVVVAKIEVIDKNFKNMYIGKAWSDI